MAFLDLEIVNWTESFIQHAELSSSFLPASIAPTADSQYSFLKKLTSPQGKSLRFCARQYPRESSWSLLSYLIVKSTGCCCSVAQFATPWTAAHQASLSFTISKSLLKLTSIESVLPSNHLILCRPLLLLPSIFPSIRVFSIQLALCIRWPKYWSFSFSISPSNEHSGLILRMDCLDLLALQGTLKSLLQHQQELPADILLCHSPNELDSSE